MAGGASILALDEGKSNAAGYVVFNAGGNPMRVLLCNSYFYDGSGGRGNQTFVLGGLGGGRVRGKRLTAKGASERADQGGKMSFGGQSFVCRSCVISGDEVWESVDVVGGVATFVVGASEALWFTCNRESLVSNPKIWEYLHPLERPTLGLCIEYGMYLHIAVHKICSAIREASGSGGTHRCGSTQSKSGLRSFVRCIYP